MFGRSKATISECVNDIESDWKEIQRRAAVEDEAEKEAKRQLIADKKKELAEKEGMKEQTTEQPNERVIPSGGGYMFRAFLKSLRLLTRACCID